MQALVEQGYISDTKVVPDNKPTYGIKWLEKECRGRVKVKQEGCSESERVYCIRQKEMGLA